MTHEFAYIMSFESETVVLFLQVSISPRNTFSVFIQLLESDLTKLLQPLFANCEIYASAAQTKGKKEGSE